MHFLTVHLRHAICMRPDNARMQTRANCWLHKHVKYNLEALCLRQPRLDAGTKKAHGHRLYEGEQAETHGAEKPRYGWYLGMR